MIKFRICYINPPVLLKRPISEIMSKLDRERYEASLLIPKKLFKPIDSSLHHSKLALTNKSRIYTYSVINPPFISAEQPLPVTPMFLVNTIKAMKKNDIIHMWVPYYITSLKIIWLKKIFFPKKKLILTMDTVPGYSFSMGKFLDGVFKIYNKLFGWLIFKTPDIITLYGESLVPYAIKAGIPREKIRVLSTGINIKKENFKDKDKNNKDVRKEFNIKKEDKIVLYAGLLVPRKGIDKIIMIANKLRKENVVFLLAGDGPKRKEYERKVEDLKLTKKILFLGWRKDMHRLYQAADMFLLPAEGEGLPGVVMEAMSYGVPCIASNIPCIPDLIDNGKSGYLCDKDNIDEFVDRIKELLKNNVKTRRISTESVNKINSFSWEKVIPRYKKLYADLMIEE